MEISILESSYNDIVTKYVDFFCSKQDLVFEYWIAERIGEVACFYGHFFFNFSDIKLDLDKEISEGIIVDWYYYSLEKNQKKGENINYYSYLNGAR